MFVLLSEIIAGIQDIKISLWWTAQPVEELTELTATPFLQDTSQMRTARSVWKAQRTWSDFTERRRSTARCRAREHDLSSLSSLSSLSRAPDMWQISLQRWQGKKIQLAEDFGLPGASTLLQAGPFSMIDLGLGA